MVVPPPPLRGDVNVADDVGVVVGGAVDGAVDEDVGGEREVAVAVAS